MELMSIRAGYWVTMLILLVVLKLLGRCKTSEFTVGFHRLKREKRTRASRPSCLRDESADAVLRSSESIERLTALTELGEVDYVARCCT